MELNCSTMSLFIRFPPCITLSRKLPPQLFLPSYFSPALFHFSTSTGGNEDRIENLTVPQKLELIQQFVKEIPVHRPLTIAQKRLLMKQTNLSNATLMAYVRKVRDPNRAITSEKKQLLENWLKENQYRVPTQKERRLLRESIDLSRQQLRHLVRTMLDPSGKVTRAKKQFFRQWYEKEFSQHVSGSHAANPQDSPRFLLTNDQLKYLRKHLRWSEKQIRHQFNRLRTPIRPLSRMEEDRMYQWLRDHQQRQGSKKTSTKDKRQCLVDVFPELHERISMEQLSHHIHKFNSGTSQQPVTEEAKCIISQWIRTHKRQPTPSEKEILQQQTGLNRKQLEHQIRAVVDVKGKVTPQVKRTIQEWIEAHNGESPEGEERIRLQHATGLSRKQLTDLLYVILHPPGEITPESKGIVLRYLERSNFSLSAQDIEELLRSTGWNRKQLTWHAKDLTKRHKLKE